MVALLKSSVPVVNSNVQLKSYASQRIINVMGTMTVVMAAMNLQKDVKSFAVPTNGSVKTVANASIELGDATVMKTVEMGTLVMKLTVPHVLKAKSNVPMEKNVYQKVGCVMETMIAVTAVMNKVVAVDAAKQFKSTM